MQSSVYSSFWRSLLTVLQDDGLSDAGSATLPLDRSLHRRKEHRDMTVEERAMADVIDLRGLIMCIALLERVHGVGRTMALTLSGLERGIEFRG